MRLSDRLAPVEPVESTNGHGNGDAAPARRTTRTRPVRATANHAKPTAKQSEQESDWAEAKRAVRELVLTELGQRAGNLTGEALAHEVRRLLDDIVKREEVKVSPLERRNFVNEVIQDT